MRAISSGHTNWNSKYYEQLRWAYVVASPVAAFAAFRYAFLSGRAKLLRKAVKRMRFVMPGSRNGPGYGYSEDGFTCKRSICVRLYSILRNS